MAKEEVIPNRNGHDTDCCKGGASHKRCEPEHCLRCFTCLRRYLYGSTQREGFAELWPVWCKRWGKLQAADAVIVAMSEYEAKYQDLKEMVLRRRKEASMGATAKDVDEKVRRGYRDPKTIVWVDGRERLEGYDWTKRVREVKRIAGGQCERLSRLGHPHALGCRDIGQDAHHIEKRSILRDDRASNLAWLSRACHNAEDNRKIRSDRAERRQQ